MQTLWNYVDVIVGIGLLLSLFVDRDKLNIRTTAKNKDVHNTNSLQKDSNKNYQEERKSTNA